MAKVEDRPADQLGLAEAGELQPGAIDLPQRPARATTCIRSRLLWNSHATISAVSAAPFAPFRDIASPRETCEGIAQHV
jgi:hypothetical protein